jgi:hypothetical protein
MQELLFVWYLNPEWWLFIAAILTLLGILYQASATAAAAKATRDSVELSRDSSKRELRAYIVVVIGEATYQERRNKEQHGPDLKFECRPLMINTGKTPATKLQFQARAAIMSIPLPPGTHLPEGYDEGTGTNALGPQQNANMFALVDGFAADDEVDSIKYGGPWENRGAKGLYCWGLITYQDIFGEKHTTQFCQQIYWDKSNVVRGIYVPGRNHLT